ncbi:MAG: hypothetical protein JSW00_06740 [Thermoplasmata archaeon]|nr:MAG: hypothetical protein JSW00_06740 [Thermoplasmata archaeon]
MCINKWGQVIYSIATSYLHSKFQESDDFRILADAESLLAKSLFNYENIALIQRMNQLAKLAYQIFVNPEENNVNKFRSDFESISNYVNSVRRQFIYDILNFVILNLNPSAKDWNPLKDDDKKRRDFLNYLNSGNAISDLAKMQVIKACAVAKIDPRKVDIKKRSEFVKKYFSAPLYLYIEILKKIAMSGCNLLNPKERRWNWVWDMQILFSATISTLNNKKVLLITTDSEMLKAAENACLSNNVIRLKEYLELIGFI